MVMNHSFLLNIPGSRTPAAKGDRLAALLAAAPSFKCDLEVRSTVFANNAYRRLVLTGRVRNSVYAAPFYTAATCYYSNATTESREYRRQAHIIFG